MATRRSRIQVKPNLKPTAKITPLKTANEVISKKSTPEVTPVPKLSPVNEAKSTKVPDDVQSPTSKQTSHIGSAPKPPVIVSKETNDDFAVVDKAIEKTNEKISAPLEDKEKPKTTTRFRMIKPKPKLIERTKVVPEKEPVAKSAVKKTIKDITPLKPIEKTIINEEEEESNTVENEEILPETTMLSEVQTPPIAPIEKRKEKIVEKPKKARRLIPRPKFGEGPPERKKMRMMDLIFWNPNTNPMKPQDPLQPVSETAQEEPEAITEGLEGETVDDPSNEPIPEKESEDILPGPRLMIGEDGQITIDETSLVIQQTAPTVDISKQKVVYETSDTSYASFKKPKKSLKSSWNLKETAKFYRALSLVGTDFTLMANIFPERSRNDLKKKFKTEERTRRVLVDKAMSEWHNFDLEDYENFMGHDEIEKIISEADAVQNKQRKQRVKKGENTAKPKSKITSKAKKTPAQKARYALLHPWSEPESNSDDDTLSLADTVSIASNKTAQLSDFEDAEHATVTTKRQKARIERMQIEEDIIREKEQLQRYDSVDTLPLAENDASLADFSPSTSNPNRSLVSTPTLTQRSPRARSTSPTSTNPSLIQRTKAPTPATVQRSSVASPAPTLTHPTLQAILNEASTALQAQGGLANVMKSSPNGRANINLPIGQLVLVSSKTPSNEQVVHVYLVSPNTNPADLNPGSSNNVVSASRASTSIETPSSRALNNTSGNGKFIRTASKLTIPNSASPNTITPASSPSLPIKIITDSSLSKTNNEHLANETLNQLGISRLQSPLRNNEH